MVWVFTSNSPNAYSPTTALCILLLHGPQTLGEIRGRTERLFQFESLEQIEQTLQRLSDREDPLIQKLPRQTGAKRRATPICGSRRTRRPGSSRRKRTR
jgi:uncharacterized protein YceH (UPF0502 family)